MDSPKKVDWFEFITWACASLWTADMKTFTFDLELIPDPLMALEKSSTPRSSAKVSMKVDLTISITSLASEAVASSLNSSLARASVSLVRRRMCVMFPGMSGLFFVHQLVIHRFWKCRKMSFLLEFLENSWVLSVWSEFLSKNNHFWYYLEKMEGKVFIFPYSLLKKCRKLEFLAWVWFFPLS